jgi:hypothetical protein
MLSSCKKLADDVKLLENDKILMPTDFESGKCWGAFATFQSMISLIYIDGKTRIHGVCAPPNGTRTRVIAIFVEYARRNPRRLNEDFILVALDALREAFPCPSK